ncbi:AbrB/MazE/SpoVT family DNA-binding domain-containing protein [bacterium]|nr:AbrB/MazE/SpoVT family DNA-binding domain-containing protein [bacterium]
MRVTSKGQVTIPLVVREAMGIRVSETEVEFIQDQSGKWYLRKSKQDKTQSNRFRNVNKVGKPRMSTDELLKLTRGD